MRYVSKLSRNGDLVDGVMGRFGGLQHKNKNKNKKYIKKLTVWKKIKIKNLANGAQNTHFVHYDF